MNADLIRVQSVTSGLKLYSPECGVLKTLKPVPLLGADVRGDHAVKVVVPLRILIDKLIRRRLIAFILHRQRLLSIFPTTS